MKPDKPGHDENQGEGDRVTARRGQRYVREFAPGGEVEPAAHGAEAHVGRAPDDAERSDLGARRGPRPTKVSLDELVARGHTVLDRVESLVRRVAGRLGSRAGRRSR